MSSGISVTDCSRVWLRTILYQDPAAQRVIPQFQELIPLETQVIGKKEGTFYQIIGSYYDGQVPVASGDSLNMRVCAVLALLLKPVLRPNALCLVWDEKARVHRRARITDMESLSTISWEWSNGEVGKRKVDLGAIFHFIPITPKNREYIYRSYPQDLPQPVYGDVIPPHIQALQRPTERVSHLN